VRVLVIEAPAPVISLDRAKMHLKVENDVEDALITGMVAAATGNVSRFIEKAIGPQTLEARFDVYEACGDLRLPFSPVINLISIAWLSASRELVTGNLADVDTTDRDVFPVGMAPWSGCYVGRDTLRITYRAGYDPVPDDIQSAILLMVGHLYHNRGAVTAEPPAAIDVLLQPYRVYA
jgi:uncharacterized phiE125 gp8 family phage protein